MNINVNAAAHPLITELLQKIRVSAVLVGDPASNTIVFGTPGEGRDVTVTIGLVTDHVDVYLIDEAVLTPAESEVQWRSSDVPILTTVDDVVREYNKVVAAVVEDTNNEGTYERLLSAQGTSADAYLEELQDGEEDESSDSEG